jgi:cysteine-rich repeat protein
MTRLAIVCLAALLTGATTSEAPAPAVCGDGTVQAGEECDDGNTRNNDGCDATCHVEKYTCGDGSVEPDDTCDGVNDDDERCAAGCQIDVLHARARSPEPSARTEPSAPNP